MSPTFGSGTLRFVWSDGDFSGGKYPEDDDDDDDDDSKSIVDDGTCACDRFFHVGEYNVDVNVVDDDDVDDDA